MRRTVTILRDVMGNTIVGMASDRILGQQPATTGRQSPLRRPRDDQIQWQSSIPLPGK